MNNQKNNVRSVDEMMSRMLTRRTTIPLFRWPVSYEDATKVLTAAYRAEVYSRHRPFIDDEATSVNIGNVAEALVTLGRPKFGTLFCGDCGNGKSTMMAAIRTASAYLDDLGCFNFHTRSGEMRPLDIRFHTIEAVDLCLPSNIDNIRSVADWPLLVIEDVGQEPMEVQLYGNIFYPVTMVLERRYNKNLPTFITTNLDPEQLGSRYGKRIRDRLREMMFIIPFDNPSYRK